VLSWTPVDSETRLNVRSKAETAAVAKRRGVRGKSALLKSSDLRRLRVQPGSKLENDACILWSPSSRPA
jgi:hypothetical protein